MWLRILVALCLLPTVVVGQQPASHDSTRTDSLTRPPIHLAPVTVTAAPVLPEQPVATVHVTQAALQQAPAFNPYDLMRQTAGVEVHDQGQGPGFASDASVRGYSSDHATDIALWVDGVPVNEPVNGHAEGYDDWNLLFPEAIADIDVMKGPTSAVYGNFAFSGIVNVRTIEKMNGSSVWLEPASFGRAGGALLTGFGNDTTRGVFGFRGVHQDGWRPHSDYTIGQGHARLVHALSPSTTLDAGVELYATSWNSPGFLNDSQFAAQDYNSVSNATDGGFKRRAQERVSLRVLASPSLLWRTTVYSTQGRWQLFLSIPPEPGAFEGTGAQTEEEDQRWGAGLTSALTWALPHGDVTVGMEGRWDHSNYQNWNTTARVRDSANAVVAAHQGSAALFIEANQDLTTRFRLTLGGRFEGRTTDDAPDSTSGAVVVGPSGPLSAGKSIFAPKVGVLYRLPAGFDVYANVSSGFRQTDGVILDPTLPYITMWAYEAGLRMSSHRVAGSVALFRNDVSNEQTFDPVTLTAVSGGASRRQGAEVALSLRATDAVHLNANWTFQDARYTSNTTADGTVLNGLRVFNTSKYVGVASIEFAPPAGPWQLSFSTNAAGPYSPFDEPGVVRPSYALFHISGGWRFGAALLQLGVRNVFDTPYRELEAGGLITPGEPRALYGLLRYHF